MRLAFGAGKCYNHYIDLGVGSKDRRLEFLHLAPAFKQGLELCHFGHKFCWEAPEINLENLLAMQALLPTCP